MPLYEYRCLDCGRTTTLFVRSMSAELSPVCEHCGSKQLQRAISSFATARAGEESSSEKGGFGEGKEGGGFGGGDEWGGGDFGGGLDDEEW